MLRSPALQGYIRDTHTRAQQGAAATAMYDRRGGAGGGTHLGGAGAGRNHDNVPTGRERKTSF
jgi:hypothetical protein